MSRKQSRRWVPFAVKLNRIASLGLVMVVSSMLGCGSRSTAVGDPATPPTDDAGVTADARPVDPPVPTKWTFVPDVQTGAESAVFLELTSLDGTVAEMTVSGRALGSLQGLAFRLDLAGKNVVVDSSAKDETWNVHGQTAEAWKSQTSGQLWGGIGLAGEVTGIQVIDTVVLAHLKLKLPAPGKPIALNFLPGRNMVLLADGKTSKPGWYAGSFVAE
jgi:hypothetical protein